MSNISKLKLALQSMLLLTGCAFIPRSVDPELEPFVEDFRAEAAVFGIEIDDTYLHAGFTDFILDTYAGYGIPLPYLKVVRIKRDYWINASPIQQRLLVYHELGHALLVRAHNHKLVLLQGFKIPISIMNDTDQVQTWMWRKCRHVYLKELFTEKFEGWDKCGQ